jgi:hypothetical protein
MGIFDFFGTGILYAAVTRIEKGIMDSETYKYFEKGDSQMIKEYKQFECTLISSAIAAIRMDIDLKNPKERERIQNIYIGKSAEFLRKIVSQKYKSSRLKLDREKANLFFKGNAESLMCFETHVIFEKYIEQLTKILNSKSLFYHKDESYFELEGNYYYSCVTNLLLAEEEVDYDDVSLQGKIISYLPISSINQNGIIVLDNFAEDLLKIIND